MVEIRNPVFDTAALATQANHADNHLKVTSEVTAPISVSTSFEYNHADLNGANFGLDQTFEYARYGGPTLAKVESVLGTVNGGHAIVHSSGLTSMFSLLLHFRPTRIVMNKGYVGSTDVANKYQKMFPNVCIFALHPCTRIREGDFVWLETPVNPTGEIEDIAFYANKARAVGATFVVDSTFAPPPLSYPLKNGADIVVHSATKYFGGHTDILAGVIITRCKGLSDALHEQRSLLGALPGNLESWLLLRSLRTLELRVTRQSSNAKMLAAWLANAVTGTNICETDGIPPNLITKVTHASLQRFNPSFNVCDQHPNGFGAVFSITLRSKEMALFVAKQLQLFTFATSLGDTSCTVDWIHGIDCSVDPCLLRLSIGIEDINDIKHDLRRTLRAANTVFSNKNKL